MAAMQNVFTLLGNEHASVLEIVKLLNAAEVEYALRP